MQRTSIYILALFVSMLLFGETVQRREAVHAGTALELDIEGLGQRASLIVEGRVLSARGRLNARGLIETEYVLDVERTFWGEKKPVRTIRLPGGVLPDGRGLMLPGMPEVRPGEDVLLFLTGASADGTRMPVGLAQGKFQRVLDRKGARVLVRDQSDLTLVDAVTGAVREADGRSVMDYAEVVARVQAVAAGRRASERSRIEPAKNGEAN